MDSLNEDVLLEIFKQLDDDSLKTASRVCQRWSQIIKELPSLTMSIIAAQDQHLNFCGQMVNGNNKIISSVESSLNDNGLLTEFSDHVAKYRNSVTNVTLNNLDFPFIISTIFESNLENLTKLSLIECCCNNHDVITIDLPNLTHLELIDSTEILQFFVTLQLKVLKISNNNIYKNELRAIFENLMNSFLKTCINLIKFTLSGFNNDSTPFYFKIDEFKFNLVSLTVEDSFINNLQEFLLSQRNSLVNIAIKSENYDDELVKAIIYNLNLKELKINVAIVSEYFPPVTGNPKIKNLILKKVLKSNALVDNIHCFNPSRNIDLSDDRDEQGVEILSFHFRQSAVANAEKILSIFSVAEEILIHDFDLSKDDFLIPIHTSMPNLKILKLSTVPSVISPIIQFNNLIHIEIDNVANELNIQNLIFLVIYSPNLKIIKINKITTEFNLNYFTTIINNGRNLEELYIGNDFIFTSEMYEAVKHVRNSRYALRKLVCMKTSHDQQKLYDESNITMHNFEISLQ